MKAVKCTTCMKSQTEICMVLHPINQNARKNVAESFTRFSNMTGICKIPWNLICVSTFPPKNHKNRILPPEHAKSATYCVTRRNSMSH